MASQFLHGRFAQLLPKVNQEEIGSGIMGFDCFLIVNRPQGQANARLFQVRQGIDGVKAQVQLGQLGQPFVQPRLLVRVYVPLNEVLDFVDQRAVVEFAAHLQLIHVEVDHRLLVGAFKQGRRVKVHAGKVAQFQPQAEAGVEDGKTAVGI